MYTRFKATEYKPEGWLRRQLEIQANGLSGNLDKVWPDVRDSAWIGGDREGWERVPYWLDGFIPLAFLLEDKDLIARAKKYIDAILERQQSDGWICPCSEEQRESYDLWAHFLIGKVFALYYDFTEEHRVLDALYRSMKCLHTMLESKKLHLFAWGQFRWFECLIPLLTLKKHYNEPWIMELGRELQKQGADYASFTERWKKPLNVWTLETHIVNIGMMFKYEALTCALFDEKYTGIAEKLWSFLEKYNGTVVGTFAGDECLAGTANNRGTELCSVAELMYSCEVLYELTGKQIWAERLEKLAFNSFPATNSDDMWTHQYLQMVNQIACISVPGKPFFGSNGGTAHLFGLEPNYGCCTANFNQAWPKLAMNVFLKSKDGILCALLLPAALKTVINDSNVTVETETQYPFRNFCKFTVKADKPINFALKIRIPSFAEKVCVNGKEVQVKRGILTVKKLWSGEESFTLSFTAQPHFVSRPFGLKAVQYGNLFFSLPIETEYKMLEYTDCNVERKFPYCDYELIPLSEWRYGFADTSLTVTEKDGDDVPFSSKAPSLAIKASFSRVNWDFAEGYINIAERKPVSYKALSAPTEMELIPYGCAKLRMTEMPIVK